MTLNFKFHSNLMMSAALFVGGCSAEPQDGASAKSRNASGSMQDSAQPAAKAIIETDDIAQDPTNVRQAALSVEGEGLRIFNPTSSAATPIAFGRPSSEVLAMLERARGPAEKDSNESCGAGPVLYANWRDGLSVVFQRDRFVGWSLNRTAKSALSTASGIGLGSTRAEMDAAYADVTVQKTTLGDEFGAGGFFGLLDGPNASSKITNMWAGVNCVAR